MLPEEEPDNVESVSRPRPWWLVALIAHLGAAGVFLLGYLTSPSYEEPGQEEPTGREIPLRSDAIPPETVWMVPPGQDTAAPAALKSSRPVLRLRRRAGGGYELLFWGNPIRKAYAYSVEAVGYKCSALRDKAGEPENMRPLPVTVPKRADGLLPLQPVVEIERLDAGTPGPIAARVSVRDASTGAVLCFGDYLLESP